MTYIYITYVAFASLLVGLMVYSRLHVTIKAMALTTFALIGVLVQQHYQDQLGAPIVGEPDGEFIYVAHQAAGDSIRLWAYTDDKGDRLYIFPYSQETAEKLEEANDKGSATGIPQSGEFVEEQGGDRSEGLRFYDWDHPRVEGKEDV